MSVIFGKWMNTLPTVAAIGAVGGLCTVVGAFWYWATPKFFEAGYMPHQPGFSAEQVADFKSKKVAVPGVNFPGFSHQIHAGKLGFDCRYCHTKIEKSAEANIPNVATCYGCHADGHVDANLVPPEKTEFIRTAYAANESIPWRRVHKLPDYVRNFPHNVHLKAGVSCYSCHGQITAMPVVYQHEPLSMGWCLDCHRDTPKNPQNHLVPPDQVTQLVKVQDHFGQIESGGGDQRDFPSFDARKLFDNLKLNPPTNCGACHF